jgi:hypothetical protein
LQKQSLIALTDRVCRKFKALGYAFIDTDMAAARRQRQVAERALDCIREKDDCLCGHPPGQGDD